MALSPRIEPGRYTIRFFIEVPRDSAVSLATLTTQFMEGIANPSTISRVESMKVELLRHRYPASWVLSGAFVATVSAAIPEGLLGTQLLTIARRTYPNAKAYRDISVFGVAAYAAPVMVPLLIPATIGYGILRAISPSTAANVGQSVWPEVVITSVRPPSANPQPEVAGSALGTLAAAATDRDSTDPARTGVIGAQVAGDAARQTREAFTLSTGSIIAIVAVSSAVAIGAGYLIVRKVL
jgi:hypothetical protein